MFDPEPQCVAEATETGLVGDRVSGRLGDPALAGAQAGRERSRLVAYGREPAGDCGKETGLTPGGLWVCPEDLDYSVSNGIGWARRSQQTP